MTGDGDTAAIDPLADRLFAAIEAGDLDELRHRCFAPDALVWHNHDGRTQTVEENLRTLRWVTQNVTGLRYEKVRRHMTDAGFVQQHVLRGSAPDGTAVEVPACLVVTVAAGRITRIDEYLDSRALGSLGS